MMTAIREIATRGAPVMALVDGESDEIAEFATNVITVPMVAPRSEEHTSELQSHSFISYAVFCLKKKT